MRLFRKKSPAYDERKSYIYYGEVKQRALGAFSVCANLCSTGTVDAPLPARLHEVRPMGTTVERRTRRQGGRLCHFARPECCGVAGSLHLPTNHFSGRNDIQCVVLLLREPEFLQWRPTGRWRWRLADTPANSLRKKALSKGLRGNFRESKCSLSLFIYLGIYFRALYRPAPLYSLTSAQRTCAITFVVTAEGPGYCLRLGCRICAFPRTG